MCSWNADPRGWTAPLPDLSRPAVKRKVRIGSRVFQVAISAMKREVPGESETHWYNWASSMVANRSRPTASASARRMPARMPGPT